MLWSHTLLVWWARDQITQIKFLMNIKVGQRMRPNVEGPIHVFLKKVVDIYRNLAKFLIFCETRSSE